MKQVIYTYILIVSVLCVSNANAQYVYDYNENCKKAYGSFLSLQPEKGQKYLSASNAQHPNNLMAVYLADYDDCLLLLFNGDKADYDRLKGNLDKRISLLAKGDSGSPWYRLCKSGVYLHWAFVSVRFGDNLKAAGLFRKSFALIKENRKQFPRFEYNDVFFGLEEAALGAIPNDYKWIASIFGLKGDIKKGAAKLNGFIARHNEDDLLYKEAYVYHAYLRFYLLTDKVGVWADLEKRQGNDDLLLQFLKANIALNSRHADDAIAVLDKAKTVQGYKNYPILDYEYAQALYLKLDKNCINYFKSFWSRYKGGLFIKDAYKKVALSYFLQGNQAAASKYKAMIADVGSTVVDADKQAARFVKESEWPNRELLKAHLLVDGGYYTEALTHLGKYKEQDFTGVADKLAYRFWMGRIFDELEEDAKAIAYYRSAIQMGRDRREHYAARSALQIGFIYEAQGKRASAILMYKQALNMDDHDYKNSIDQQAKAGINRLED